MFKDFKSKFAILTEEEISRYRQGGILMGDYVKIRKDILKNPKLAGRPSQFYDKIKELINSELPLKASAIKSMRPESQHGLFGGADAPTDFWVDVVQLASPGLFINPVTLPLEVLDVVNPEGNNFSPEHPDNWSYDSKVQIKPAKVEIKDTDLLKHTDGDKRNLPTKDQKGEHVKEPKDGRDEVEKPEEYKFRKKSRKESVDMTDDELMMESYISTEKPQ